MRYVQTLRASKRSSQNSEAKKLFELCVLDYIVTSNHIHLLVKDTGEDVIAQSMQLISESEVRSNRSSRSIPRSESGVRSKRFNEADFLRFRSWPKRYAIHRSGELD